MDSLFSRGVKKFLLNYKHENVVHCAELSCCPGSIPPHTAAAVGTQVQTKIEVSKI
jgi:hypothetical protein